MSAAKYFFPIPIPILILLISCARIDKKSTIAEAENNGVNSAELADLAEVYFETTPRTVPRIKQAAQLMAEAALHAPAGSKKRYDYLFKRANYNIWLAVRETDSGLITALAEDAVLSCNTAIQQDSSRVEGFYYRGIALGLIGQENKLKGRDAMFSLRKDAMTAIVIDSTFDYGGPYRLLGALYLRAPGPPAGIGSKRKALHYLKKARALAPNHPENILFYSEALLAQKEHVEAKKLLETLEEHMPHYGDATDGVRWTALRKELERKLR